MNSFLLINKHDLGHREDAIAFCVEKGIETIDITIIDAQETKTDKANTSANKKGIALIRQIIQSISLKSIRGKGKAVIILHAEMLSLPAQNALLKTLEEPPPETIIVLTAENEHLLLPTILSRCLIINTPLGNNSKYTESIPNLEPLDPDQALVKAEELGKDKKKALEFLENQIKSLNLELKQTDQDAKTIQVGNVLKEYFDTYKVIKSTNVNLRFALENLFLVTTN